MSYAKITCMFCRGKISLEPANKHECDPTNTDELEFLGKILDRLFNYAYKKGEKGEKIHKIGDDYSIVEAEQAIITKLRERDERVATKARIQELQFCKSYMISTSPFIESVIDPRLEDYKNYLATLKPNSEESDE